MGLANARRRLRELYGEEQSLEVRAAGGGGVAATVSIPFHDAAGGAPSEVVIREDTDAERDDEALAQHTLSLLPRPYQNLAVNATNSWRPSWS